MKKNFDLEKFYRIYYPAVASLVTSKDNIMAVAWQCPLSKSPPMFGVSIAEKRHTYKLIEETKEFAVNFVENKYLEDLMYCGSNSGENVDKFEETNLTPEDAEKINSKIIKEAVGVIECKLDKRIETGDHYFIVGDVVNVKGEEDYLENPLKYKRPYHFSGKNFGTTSDKKLEI